VDGPVVIAAFLSQDEAIAAQRVLQDEGIAADAEPRTDDIERMCVDAFDSGFDVIVRAGDAEPAIALLRRVWPDEAAAEPKGEERCPACASSDVARMPRLRIFLIVALLMVVGSIIFEQRSLFLLLMAIVGGLLLLTPRQRCRACGERWR
jgi:hypothetical protein